MIDSYHPFPYSIKLGYTLLKHAYESKKTALGVSIENRLVYSSLQEVPRLIEMENNQLEQAREESELDQYSHEDDMITSPQIDYTNTKSTNIVNAIGSEEGELLELESDAIDEIEVEKSKVLDVYDQIDHENQGKHNEELEGSMDDEYSNIDEEDTDFFNLPENIDHKNEMSIHDDGVSILQEELVDNSNAAIATENQYKQNFNEEGSGLTSVIELESDDDIENLEEDITETYKQHERNDYRDEDNALNSQDSQVEQISEFGDEYDEDVDQEEDKTAQPIHSQVISILQDSPFSNEAVSSGDDGVDGDDGDDDDDQLVELTRSQYEETEVSSPHSGSTIHYEPSEIQSWLQSPVCIVICDDKYLLAPFNFKDTTLESIISLFSWDEVADCSILNFFLFLRHNGDLIDAYNFNSNDELKLRFSELQISITEDTVQAQDTKLADLLYLFQSLKNNSDSLTDSPSELTIHLSMQKRFITQLAKLKSLCSEGKGFNSIIQSYDESNLDVARCGQESQNKKRRFVS